MVHSYSDAQLISNELRDQLLEGSYKKNGKYLNLGCGNDYYKESGWVNLDGCEDINADVYCDLDDKNLIIPLKTNSFDIIWASHILEHIWYLRVLKDEMVRILKPGGALLIVVPYYLFACAWGDDTHCRAFSTQSFQS